MRVESLEFSEVHHPSSIIHPKNVRTYLKTLSSDGKLRRILSDEFLSLIEAARKTQMALEEKQTAIDAPAT